MKSNCIRKIYWTIWFFLGNTNGLYFPFKVMFINRWKRKCHDEYKSRCYDVNSFTGLVWEGFPSSGNSTSSRAILSSINKRFAITNHTHSANIVLKGVNSNIPVAILIRDPLSCVESMTRRWQFMDPGQCLDWYVRFYERLMPEVEHILVIKFETVIANFELVIRALNDQFQLDISSDLDINAQWHTGKALRELDPEILEKKRNDKNLRKESISSLHADKLIQAKDIHEKFTINAI